MEMLHGWSVPVLTRFKTGMELFGIVIVQSVKYNGPVRLRVTVHKIMNWFGTVPQWVSLRLGLV